MKKRMFALLCALVLVLTLSPAPSRATDTVYFTAVNDTILELSDATMPFWTNGYLYIPASIFQSGSSTSRALGVQSSLSTDKKTLMLYARNALIFNLETGSTTDGQDNSYPESAVTRGGQAFVPFARVAEFFNLKRNTMTVPGYGFLVRLCNNAYMPDSLFLDSATSNLARIYNNYKNGGSGETTSPAVTAPVEETVPEGSHVLYLGILVDDIGETSNLLDVLDAQAKSRAAFYLPAALLESAGDLTRRMRATGHAIGLWADGSAGAEDALEQLERANRLLSRHVGGKTRLCYLADATEQTVAQVSAAGWRVLTPRLDFSYRALDGSSAAAALHKRLAAYTGSVTIWLNGGTTASGLRAFLISTRAAQDKLLPLTELVQ